MILDQLTRAARYTAVLPRLDLAFQFLRQTTPGTPVGRQDLDGDAVYALVQRYTTRPVDAGRLEAHRQYVDVQYLVAGRETILWAPTSLLTTVTMPYTTAQDAALYASTPEATPVHLNAGDFVVLFPEDAHAPCLQWDGPSEVVKVVVKVRL